VPVLVVWLVLAVAGAGFGGRVFDRATDTAALRPDAESVRAQQRLDQLLPEGPVIVAVVGGRDVYDPGLVASVTRVDAEIRALPGVVDVDDLYSGAGGRIGADNRSTLIRVELARGLADAERRRVEDAVVAALHRVDAPRVLVGGETLARRAFAEQAVRDAARGEAVAFAVLLVVLVVLLGGVLAAAVPVVAALAAVASTLLGLLALTGVTPVSQFTVNVVTLLGIGLTVDYALLVVARYREERAADPEAGPGVWLGRTMATAGRAVLTSGLAVGVAMAGLSVFAEPLLASMALGGAAAVLLATAAGLTAVPALVAVFGDRLGPAPAGVFRRWVRADRPAVPLLARLARYAQRRPLPVAAAVCAGLLLLAGPFVLGAELGDSDVRALPRSAEARQAYDVLQRDFDAGRAAPVVVVVSGDPAGHEVRDLMNQLIRLPQVLRLQPRPDVPGAAAVLDLTPRGGTGGEPSRELVRAVRDLETPLPVLVGGPAAELVDYRGSVADRLPLVVLVLLVATGVLLFAVTGSLVVPVKALLMNVLTLLATLGVLVVVFQWGVGAGALGFEPWGGIDLTTPVLLFVFVFGLSMDYEVFLLARIREEWDRGASGAGAQDRAVLAGITRTGPVVTAAAVSVGVVFLGFLLGELTAVKEIGLGLVVAVAIDVTVVRGLLLPAVMSLLGEWNWWAPAALRRWGGRRSAPPQRVRVSG
jgi:RND superfamily putative drug exporter